VDRKSSSTILHTRREVGHESLDNCPKKQFHTRSDLHLTCPPQPPSFRRDFLPCSHPIPHSHTSSYLLIPPISYSMPSDISGPISASSLEALKGEQPSKPPADHRVLRLTPDARSCRWVGRSRRLGEAIVAEHSCWTGGKARAEKEDLRFVVIF